MTHPDDRAILRYVSDSATEGEQFDIDAHVAECEQCLSRIRALLYLRDNFDRIWTSWTAEEHGRITERLRLIEALGELAKASPSSAERLSDLLKGLARGTQVTVRLLISKASRLASAGVTTLPPGFSATLRPAVAGVGTPEAALVQAHRERSSKKLSEGSPGEAVLAAQDAAQISPLAIESSSTDIKSEGRLTARVVLDSARQTASVFYFPHGRPQPMYVVALVPEKRERDSWAEPAHVVEPLPQAYFLDFDLKDMASGFLFAILLPVEGAEHYLAEFTNLPDGVYTIILPT